MRALAKEIETAVPATATSIDGRVFSYQAAVGSSLVSPGGYVALEVDGGRLLGQIVTQELVVREGPEIGLGGRGRGARGGDRARPTGSWRARAPCQSRWEPVVTPRWRRDGRRCGYSSGPPESAGLETDGRVIDGEPRRSMRGFDRHLPLWPVRLGRRTAGVILERLLLGRPARRRLTNLTSSAHETRPDAIPAAQRFSDLRNVVRRAEASGDTPLRLRVGKRDAALAASTLDPIADGEEFAARTSELAGRRGDRRLSSTRRGGAEPAVSASAADRNLGIDRDLGPRRAGSPRELDSTLEASP
jgi:hypothetical protein